MSCFDLLINIKLNKIKILLDRKFFTNMIQGIKNTPALIKYFKSHKEEQFNHLSSIFSLKLCCENIKHQENLQLVSHNLLQEGT